VRAGVHSNRPVKASLVVDGQLGLEYNIPVVCVNRNSRQERFDEHSVRRELELVELKPFVLRRGGRKFEKDFVVTKEPRHRRSRDRDRTRIHRESDVVALRDIGSRFHLPNL